MPFPPQLDKIDGTAPEENPEAVFCWLIFFGWTVSICCIFPFGVYWYFFLR